LQGVEIYSEKYKLCGKIDLFDIETGKLWDRKRSVKKIYDGYVFQLYAHYHALTEMGYEVKNMMIYDISHNRNYPIALPTEDPDMQRKFEDLIYAINQFDMNSPDFVAIEAKCRNCIYSNLCDYSLA